MIEGNDGGACVSFNGGATWSTIYNQPTAQFYHVDTDNRFPYQVYGTQQDNSAVAVPSRSHKGAILWGDCYAVGNSESGHIAVHPNDPNVVFSGAIGSAPGGGGTLLRYDHATAQVQIVTVWPEVYGGWGPKDLKYRFQWTYPICFSPHDANVLYVTGNRVFRSINEGASWEAISPDLTRNDESKLGPSGGPITKDTTGAEHYCTIFAFAESPHEPGVFWSGSDDGLLHLSRDHGATWTNITPPDLPEWALISTIEPSPHDPASAYMAATRYKLDDCQPYLYKTRDYGASWERITEGLPPDDFTRVIREDPNRRGLLYAGTETGLYVSLDDGASWRAMQGNLPVVPVYDLVIKDQDLVVATHGRSFWILDDLTPLYQLTDEIAQHRFHLYTPRQTYRLPGVMGGRRPADPGKNYRVAMGYAATFTETQTPEGDSLRTYLDAGTNPPNGVIVTYTLNEPADAVTLRFLDAQGELIRAFSSQAESNNGTSPHVAAAVGTHRFVWNMRYADARAVAGDKSTERDLSGPVAPPGSYQVELDVGGDTQRASFEICTDPRLRATQADLQAQFDLLINIRDKISETHDAINRMDRVSQQAQEWIDKTEGQPTGAAIAEAAKGLLDAVGTIEQELIEKRIQAPHDRLHYPTRLNVKLAALTSVVASADTAPTQQAHDVFDEISARIDQQLERWKQLLANDVATFSQLVRNTDIPAIVP